MFSVFPQVEELQVRPKDGRRLWREQPTAQATDCRWPGQLAVAAMADLGQAPETPPGGPPAESGRSQGVRRVCKLEGCERRAWVDVKTGEEKDYCGRTHAANALEQQGKGARLRGGQV